MDTHHDDEGYEPFACALTLDNLTYVCMVLSFIKRGACNSKDICRHISTPRRYPEQMLQKMRKLGLINGRRGPRGGYEATEMGRRATVEDIVDLLWGENDSVLVTAWRKLAPEDVTFETTAKEEAA